MPLYETSDDLGIERAIADRLQAAWHCSLRKLNPTSPIDFCAMRGKKVVAWVEIKRRKKTMEEIAGLGGVMVNLEKMAAARDISQITNIPFMLVLGTTDGVYAARFIDEFAPDDLTVCGRVDRNDPNDVETCAIYRAHRFREV